MAPFPSGHDDCIQDVAYDYYGQRIATCSSDCKINVFEHDPQTNTWTASASWKAHDATVLRELSWAHPQFGQVLASCSVDRTVKIWQEQTQGQHTTWTEKARILDSKAPILQVSFAPMHLGLKLATIAGDAILRIYESAKPNDLTTWSLQEELSSLPPNAPPQYSGDSSFTFAWCPSRLAGQQLVVAANNFVQLYRPDDRGLWRVAEIVQQDGGLVRCVAWAPGGQRGYELIATGSKAGLVRIYKLTESLEGMMVGGGGYTVEMLGQFEHSGGVFQEVNSLMWNITGTVLSSSGDDGRIRLWKEDHLGKWRQHFALSAERGNSEDSQMQDQSSSFEDLDHSETSADISLSLKSILSLTTMSWPLALRNYRQSLLLRRNKSKPIYEGFTTDILRPSEYDNMELGSGIFNNGAPAWGLYCDSVFFSFVWTVDQQNSTGNEIDIDGARCGITERSTANKGDTSRLGNTGLCPKDIMGAANFLSSYYGCRHVLLDNQITFIRSLLFLILDFPEQQLPFKYLCNKIDVFYIDPETIHNPVKKNLGSLSVSQVCCRESEFLRGLGVEHEKMMSRDETINMNLKKLGLAIEDLLELERSRNIYRWRSWGLFWCPIL